MSTLAERAMAEMARAEAEHERTSQEAAAAARKHDAQIAARALRRLGVHPEEIEVDGDRGEARADGLTFRGFVRYGDDMLQIVAPCPDCGETVGSYAISDLFDLGRVLRYQERRESNWIISHNCPARKCAGQSTQPQPLSQAEQLVALIRQIARNEAENAVAELVPER